MIIEFKEEASDFTCVLGGIPPLANFENWPINPQTNNKLVHLLTLYSNTQRPMTDDEMQIQRTLLDESDMGIDKSSILEFPFFEQENIVPLPPMKYSFKMQINEWDIDKLSNGEYNGIFKGEFGYLWLDNNFRKLKENSVVELFGIQW